MEGDCSDDFKAFVALHGPALSTSGIPPQYWQSLWQKLDNEVFDAGEYFGIMQVEEIEEEEREEGLKNKQNPGNELCYKVIITNENGLQAVNPNSIFLIDHAWTYRVEHARQQLLQVPGLLHRMANLMGIDFHGEVPDEGTVDQVLEEMWKYNQTYQLSHGSAEEKVPVWYIMDEFGSRIQHSDEPTFATAPLFYMPQQIAYTVLWPLRDLDTGEEVTRDFAYGESDRLIRKCRLLPWLPGDVLDISYFTNEPSEEHYQAILNENKEKLPISIKAPVYDKKKIFRVYTDLQQVLQNLTHPRFAFTNSEEEADILYNFSHFKDYRKLSEERPHVLLNQFPCENLLTVKDCLASISRRVGGSEGPKWLPRTFNLHTELPQFISYFQHRERIGEDNHWICKPWNLARSLDTHITKNLNNIIRQRENIPKVVSKYIENPVLFHLEDVGLVKFDIRYVVLLRSVQPLRLYVYDVFWLRFSNRLFSLDDLDDYEKHFTVMNYAPGVSLKQIHYNEFIPLFEKQNSEFSWKAVEEVVFKAFVELFQAACAKPAPLGICDYPSSRAIYAIDLMLKWDTSDGKPFMQPQILEVNFNPDCDRACKYHPTFFNDVFSTLFLDEPNDCHVTSIV
ncbi:tubulin--tyrosine ligase-like protein 12 [Hemicordylus capensis]|uniref:tubulin--tyrosine ligase-like protein 12 n=1 Tax=Hemicordylus capensis TaxID=884348 RepID=UPI002302A4F3|nr:tubulin--tyrosine ligase-like protein 12 [Hemicordylus capensis]